VLAPVIVGAGKPAVPAGIHSKLQLTDTRTFPNGFVYLSDRLQDLTPTPQWPQRRPSTAPPRGVPMPPGP
jgi:hypothetical protein